MWDEMLDALTTAVIRSPIGKPPTTTRRSRGTVEMALDIGREIEVKRYAERNPGNQEPLPGAFVYCMLGVVVEHSGIYIGGGNLIHLNGRGEVEVVTVASFTDHFTTINRDIFIPMDAEDKVIGSSETLMRALNMVGKERDYNIFLDNCHQFSAGCITGDYESANNFLTWVKDEFNKEVGMSCRWGRWNWKSSPFRNTDEGVIYL
ncbi:lecithin retinol acyltransferase family protein (plasmid) [Bacillus cereus]|uniref:LRAT domain-containing protein n=1 Tax=Bacillus cereus (strain ZK / E33L) TaxID=288681 RepID=Q4V0Z5_BACCZ|nr:lecithin retinol acyltransferase family protein [Bacillus cereus]AAY60612.1 conserved hypothetical protein [Bacillus cereus E33L]AJI25889.1 lecithin retinol acyltransferase family protein [Bacillus cereus E33L]QQA24533.1 lecithin retinol acyltransferase family protein [Bacillus cereus]